MGAERPLRILTSHLLYGFFFYLVGILRGKNVGTPSTVFTSSLETTIIAPKKLDHPGFKA